MNFIKEFYAARLSRNAVIEFFHNFMALVEACESVKTKMARVYAALVAAATGLFRAAEQTQKSDLTDPIFQLDAQRDIFWTALDHAVLAQTKSLDEEIRVAAISVQNTMNSLRVNTNAQYLRESGALDTVLSVLLGEKLEAVTATGLLPLVNQLKDANDTMHRLLAERNEENTEKPVGAFEAARREAEAVYREFVRFANAWWVINVEEANQPDADLEHFFNLTNTLIDQYNRTQKLGGTSGAGGAETLPPTDGEETGSEETEEGEQGSEEQQPTFTVTYIKGQYTWMTQQYAAGERIVPPAEPEAFRWVDVPEFMPDHDITIYAQYVG